MATRFLRYDSDPILRKKCKAALENFDRFPIFFQFIGNGGLGRTLAVFFVGFPNILDNEIEVIKKLFPADKFHKICYLFDRR